MEISLAYEEKGQGTPFVMLHGNGEDRRYFKYQLAYFSRHYRVVLLETRGHGASPRGRAPFTIDQFARDLKDFLDEKGFEKIILLGFSDGGNIALTFGAKYPGYLSRLIVNGANLSPWGVRAKDQAPYVADFAFQSLLAPFSKKAAEKRELLDLVVRQPHIDPASLGAISVPTLVVAGKEDMIRESETRRIAAAIPGSILRILPGDHFLARRRWKEFNALLDDFLEGRLE